MAHKKTHKFSIFLIVVLLLASILIGVTVLPSFLASQSSKKSLTYLEEATVPSYVDKQIIAVNGSSRRGIELKGFKDIVIHYVANPQSTAQQNHDWFASNTSGISSHFLVGLSGEIIQNIPLNEISSASNWRNDDTISIEVCHPDETGKFNEKTYNSLVKLTAWLCDVGQLTESNIIRHYDITGKNCPKYFVEHEDAWIRFKEDVMNAM